MPNLKAISPMVLVALIGLSVPVSAGDKPSLAIFSLRSLEIEAMNIGGDLLSSLHSSLESGRNAMIMPRRAMEDKLAQAGLAQNDNPEQVLKAGKALAVDYVLFGSISNSAGMIIADIRLMDIGGERPVKTWLQRIQGQESMAQLASTMAREIIQAMTDVPVSHIHLKSHSISETTPSPFLNLLKPISKSQGIEVGWEMVHSVPVQEFRVYRSNSIAGPYQLVGKTAGSPYIDSTCTQEVAYYLVGVILKDGVEIRAKDPSLFQKEKACLLHPPLLLSGKGGVRRASLEFVPSPLNQGQKIIVVKFILLRRNLKDSTWTRIAEINPPGAGGASLSLTASDQEGLEDGKDYSYAMIVIDTQGSESGLSEIMTIKTLQRPVLQVQEENQLRRIQLRWNAIEKALGYTLWRKTTADSANDWLPVAKLKDPKILSYTDNDTKNLKDGATYHYRLTAFDEKADTLPSEVVSAKTKPLPPPPAQLQTTSGQVRSVTLSWQPLNDQDIGGYSIYRGLNNKTLELAGKVKNRAVSTFTDKPSTPRLEDGKTYFYSLASFNLHLAEGDLTVAVSATTKPAPAPVAALTVIPATDHNLIKWQKNTESDISGYLIFRSQNDGGWSKLAESPIEPTEYMDKNLTPKALYRYRVIAKDKDGLLSSPVDIETLMAPGS